MPFINVLIAGEADPHLSARVAGEIARLTSHHLRKDPAVTAVAVSYVAPSHWFAGGKVISDAGAPTYWVDIKITEATNTKDQMEAYIAGVHAAMAELLGGVHEESYVLVDAVPAAAYGYGGRTQEYRYIANKVGAGQ